MKNVDTVLKAVEESLTCNPVIYPLELLARHNISDPFDAELLSYLVDGGESGGYFHWLTRIAALSDAKLIVELGNRYGSSTVALYHGLKPDQTLITLDIAKDQRYVPDHIFEDARVKFVFGDCLDLNAYGDARTPIPVDIDIFWTDTIHYYEQVRDEFYVYEPPFADEALIAIDDIRLNDKGKFFEEVNYPKHDLTSLCHVSGFGAIHYVRPVSDRGKSHDSRIMEALARANRVWIRRANKAQSKIEALDEELNGRLILPRAKAKLRKILPKSARAIIRKLIRRIS